MRQEVWLVVGKEVSGNNVKRYCFLSSNGNRQWVQHCYTASFIRKHEVLNAKVNGDLITGNGMQLSTLPKYIKQDEFGLQQVGGMTEQQVLQQCQPLINAWQQKQNQKQMKESASSTDKNNKLQYIINKLQIIDYLLDKSLTMKNLTNAFASEGELTRYLKQIDIDNSEFDSLSNMVKNNGVNGLANGLTERLNAISSRATKYNLQSENINGITIKDIINTLKNKCETLRKLHAETKEIIQSNREQEKQQKEEDKQEAKEIKQQIDNDIPIISDEEEENLIPIEQYSSEDIPVISDDETENLIEISNDIAEDIPVISNDETDNLIEIPPEEKKIDEVEPSYEEIKHEQISQIDNITNIMRNTLESSPVYSDVEDIKKFLHNIVTNLIFDSNCLTYQEFKSTKTGRYVNVAILNNNIDGLIKLYINTKQVRTATNIRNQIDKDIISNVRNVKEQLYNETILSKIDRTAEKLLDYFILGIPNVNELLQSYYDYSLQQYNTKIDMVINQNKIEQTVDNERLEKIRKSYYSKLYNEDIMIQKYASRLIQHMENIEQQRELQLRQSRIKEEASYLSDNIEQQINALEDIDMHYIWSTYDDLCENNPMVSIYKPVLKSLEIELNRVKDKLKNANNKIDELAVESATITSASAEEIAEALKIFDDF